MTSTRRLKNLVKRVAKQELELDALKKRLNVRLDRLNRRRQELCAELQRVEAEISVVTPSGITEPPSANGRKTAARRPGVSRRRALPGRPSLRAILVDIFKKSGRTLSVSELVDQVRKTGYRSSSKDFKNLLWVSLGRIPELQRDPQGGYRLKKGKA